METTEIALNIPESIKTARSALQEAQGLTIADGEGFTSAGARREALLAVLSEINATFDGPIAAAHAAHKAMVAAKKTHADPVEAAQRLIKQKMIDFDEEQKRLREIEQIRLDKEAKEQGEREALELAAELEKAGLKQEALEVIEAPASPATKVAPKTTPKVEGFVSRSIWGAQVTDLRALLEAVMAGKVPMQAIKADEIFLGQQARALKSAMKWPGVTVTERKV